MSLCHLSCYFSGYVGSLTSDYLLICHLLLFLLLFLRLCRKPYIWLLVDMSSLALSVVISQVMSEALHLTTCWYVISCSLSCYFSGYVGSLTSDYLLICHLLLFLLLFLRLCRKPYIWLLVDMSSLALSVVISQVMSEALHLTTCWYVISCSLSCYFSGHVGSLTSDYLLICHLLLFLLLFLNHVGSLTSDYLLICHLLLFLLLFLNHVGSLTSDYLLICHLLLSLLLFLRSCRKPYIWLLVDMSSLALSLVISQSCRKPYIWLLVDMSSLALSLVISQVMSEALHLTTCWYVISCSLSCYFSGHVGSLTSDYLLICHLLLFLLLFLNHVGSLTSDYLLICHLLLFLLLFLNHVGSLTSDYLLICHLLLFLLLFLRSCRKPYIWLLVDMSSLALSLVISQVMSEALQLQQDMHEFKASFKKEIADVIERTPLTIRPRKTKVDLDAGVSDDPAAQMLPPPLIPQVVSQDAWRSGQGRFHADLASLTFISCVSTSPRSVVDDNTTEKYSTTNQTGSDEASQEICGDAGCAHHVTSSANQMVCISEKDELSNQEKPCLELISSTNQSDCFREKDETSNQETCVSDVDLPANQMDCYSERNEGPQHELSTQSSSMSDISCGYEQLGRWYEHSTDSVTVDLGVSIGDEPMPHNEHQSQRQDVVLESSRSEGHIYQPDSITIADHATPSGRDPDSITIADHATPSGRDPDSITPSGRDPDSITPSGRDPDSITIADHATPSGRDPDSITPSGRNPDSITPSGRDPDSITPSGRDPDSITPSGRDPDSITPSGRDPDSITPSGRDPDSITPSERDPDSITPSGRDPDSITPSGRDPDSITIADHATPSGRDPDSITIADHATPSGRDPDSIIRSAGDAEASLSEKKVTDAMETEEQSIMTQQSQ